MNKKALLTLTLAGIVSLGCINVYAEDSKEWEYKEATLSLTIDNSSTLDGFMAVAELAEEKLGIKLDIEYIPGGEEGLNVAMTRLAAGEISHYLNKKNGHVACYATNSGS